MHLVRHNCVIQGQYSDALLSVKPFGYGFFPNRCVRVDSEAPSPITDIFPSMLVPAEHELFLPQRPGLKDLKEISKMESPITSINLTQHAGGHTLRVYASEFDPLPGDVISYKWRDKQGVDKAMEMPYLCLAAIEKVRNHLGRYFESTRNHFLESLFAQDPLIAMTAAAAMEYTGKKSVSFLVYRFLVSSLVQKRFSQLTNRMQGSLVKCCLDMCAMARMTEISWEATSDEYTLGITPIIDDQINPGREKIPIPPIMQAQLYQMAIKTLLAPARAEISRRLEDMISPPTPENWFDTYLSAFILLNHIEHLARRSVSNARLAFLPVSSPHTSGSMSMACCECPSAPGYADRPIINL